MGYIWLYQYLIIEKKDIQRNEYEPDSQKNFNNENITEKK